MYNLSISQNNLINEKLVENLVKNANFQNDDLVIEIGGGKGIITQQLLKYSNNIISFELDLNLYNSLITHFKDNNIEILNQDFLKYTLPSQKFSIFSNIPFNITSDIFKKLLSTKSMLQTAYLVMQIEAALMFCGEQLNTKNTLKSIIHGISYEFEIIHKFQKNDFIPQPSVECVLVKIKKREIPLISNSELEMFYDFVAYIFNNSTPNVKNSRLFSDKQIIRFKKESNIDLNKTPSNLKIVEYIKLYQVLKGSDQMKKVIGIYEKLENRDINKVNRTRNFKS